jgi:dTDP-L-rhamnose 4-epimerase
VFEDGAQRRDFVHVAGVARANVLALSGGEPRTGAFNVASGQPRTVLDMARALGRGDGAPAPAPVVTGDYGAGDVRHVFASAEGAAQGLGFHTEIGLDEGWPSSPALRCGPSGPAIISR